MTTPTMLTQHTAPTIAVVPDQPTRRPYLAPQLVYLSNEETEGKAHGGGETITSGPGS
ncbi:MULTISPECIES: hypothetical protein [unclassified Undibacterium]|uniref:hypothetical protein n=1 Tax=unclassified Undibacterium TaxID=2630295 RepID=UPI002AC91ACE|nr:MULTISPECIES: hypothetical protein [unclassified Undibacterium]MEB0140578.1 hypothetical protein [Undibacterium sp. CCC2.1]MEB0173632.1 hypothetical protein [Undibacterium sp. CCC1.1]MEB0177344.1 hypothetical protein [Undibacterium sp. CCC3.4]MEB0216755.1 hypothetical protein [Undibacterium sp. 5I2]WPX44565.1 hypothetical protein RHM61_04870 [Undibacterium sp. CCC3.4]